MSYVYVIMPVGADPRFSEKKRILEELGSRCGVQLVFPHDRREVFDVGRAVSDICGADLILADLSRERPSCYYELGLANGAGIPAVVIADADTVIHQVAEPGDVRFYADLPAYRLLVSELLSSARRSNSPPTR